MYFENLNSVTFIESASGQKSCVSLLRDYIYISIPSAGDKFIELPSSIRYIHIYNFLAL